MTTKHYDPPAEFATKESVEDMTDLFRPARRIAAASAWMFAGAFIAFMLAAFSTVENLVGLQNVCYAAALVSVVGAAGVLAIVRACEFIATGK